MNDLNLREIPEDTGYSLSLILSLVVHAVLAGLLWAGAMMHRAPDTQHTSIQSRSSLIAQSAPSAIHQSPAALPAGANPMPILASAGEARTETAKAMHGSDARRSSTASAKTLDAVTQPYKPIRRSAPELNKPSKLTHERATLAAVKTEKPPSKNKDLVRSRKAESTSNRRIAKAEPIRTSKKIPGNKISDKPDIAETRKLEGMRDAELRRISKSIS